MLEPAEVVNKGIKMKPVFLIASLHVAIARTLVLGIALLFCVAPVRGAGPLLRASNTTLQMPQTPATFGYAVDSGIKC